MRSDSLPINEIFYSLQGEGFHSGTPAVFVRLSGCNLRCPFCDTDHSHSTPMTVSEILAEVTRYPAPTVILTGGEPSLYDIDPLIRALHDHGRRVHIETNGTRALPDSLDWITCSPKPGGAVVLPRCNELKIVYTGQDVEAIAESIPADHHFLQPCSGANIAEVIDYILFHPRWRLSLQTHKLLDIR
ncbi:MAG: 7-carboxy-7-deazaguanine synthase QueE [Muribaculaceae bacterium]|nr:7-carboxy-7-deazaguanine synthase QueE [Muribaculaceae bacterium]